MSTAPAALTNLREVAPGQWTYGLPAPRGHRECWTPVRHVARDQACDSCWSTIRRCAPGNTKGTRGTKAYLEPKLQLWRCLGCGEAGEA